MVEVDGKRSGQLGRRPHTGRALNRGGHHGLYSCLLRQACKAECGKWSAQCRRLQHDTTDRT